MNYVDSTKRMVRILIVGCGTLGARAARLLISYGVTELALCDYDVVQGENLTHQPYVQDDIGRLKVDALRDALLSLNSVADIVVFPQPFAPELLEGITLVLEGTDTLGVRLVLNDACVQAKIPLVIAAASATSGLVFSARPGGPCWQCVMARKRSEHGCEGITTALADAVVATQVDVMFQTLACSADNSRSTDNSSGELLVIENGREPERILVAKNPSCAACHGEFGYLTTEPGFTLETCTLSGKLQARPRLAHALDLDELAHGRIVLVRYPTAIKLVLANGSVLVHRHGLCEFENVDEKTARMFAAQMRL